MLSETLIRQLEDTGIISFDRSTSQYRLTDIMEMYKFPISLGFEDVAIEQVRNTCKSRLDANTTSEVFRGVFRPTPLIASNMSSVVNSNFCIKLYELGALGMMHRAASDEHVISEVKKIARECSVVVASIGFGEGQFDLCTKLVNAGANVIVVDVANGYSDYVIEFGLKVKRAFSHVKLVIGSTTNVGMLEETADFVDAIRVGIGQGFACDTKITAGCTEKQFSAVYKFRTRSKELGVPIISDGGTRVPADFTKAIAAGANSVMAGSIFARCPESAAELVELEGGKKAKVYFGMASTYNQERWRGGLKPGTCSEGGIRHLDVGESVDKLVERYTGALRSGMTYTGSRSIREFQEKARFIRV